MKKLFTMALIASAALAFQACNNGAKDSKETADSTNAVKDSSTHPATTGGIAVDKDDADFATKAGDGGMAEVAYAKLALQKATSAKVKEFAQAMITDHTKANTELMAVAQTKNITLPAAPSAEHQKMATDAAAKSGAEFDKQYVNDMVADHKEDVSLFEKASTDCKDPELKAFAAKTLPTLKMHLDMINKIHDSMK
jgi:putative membrane protein